MHIIARHLGMTVAELSQRLGYREMMDWIAFDNGPGSGKPEAHDWESMTPNEISKAFGIKNGG